MRDYKIDKEKFHEIIQKAILSQSKVIKIDIF